MTATCPARMTLENADGSTHMNAARRRLYNELEAQLGRIGLRIGVHCQDMAYMHDWHCYGLRQAIIGVGQEQTQGLDARALFHLRDGRLEPALHALK